LIFREEVRLFFFYKDSPKNYPYRRKALRAGERSYGQKILLCFTIKEAIIIKIIRT